MALQPVKVQVILFKTEGEHDVALGGLWRPGDEIDDLITISGPFPLTFSRINVFFEGREHGASL